VIISLPTARDTTRPIEGSGYYALRYIDGQRPEFYHGFDRFDRFDGFDKFHGFLQ
jgi:hypothetical protein